MARLLLIVDDDALSREVLALLAEEAGFDPVGVDSGEAALAHLALAPRALPSALLVDMQMPGLAGDPLALRLRAAAGPEALLVAMSGTAVAAAKRMNFDTFLLKPFGLEAFASAFSAAPTQPEAAQTATPSDEVLSAATYASFAQSMPPVELAGLYRMLLDDLGRRTAAMRTARKAGDAEAWSRAAHAMRGGCGMVGALELASLAAAMEEGLPPDDLVDQVDPLARFETAVGRLRAILSAHTQRS